MTSPAADNRLPELNALIESARERIARDELEVTWLKVESMQKRRFGKDRFQMTERKGWALFPFETSGDPVMPHLTTVWTLYLLDGGELYPEMPAKPGPDGLLPPHGILMDPSSAAWNPRQFDHWGEQILEGLRQFVAE